MEGGTPVSVLNKIHKLRERIKQRSLELGIETAHDSTGHWYRYKDKLYPSVTRGLQVLKDPALANWKMNRALEYVQKALESPKQPPLSDIIAAAKLAPQLEFENAGSIGNQVHQWREDHFRQIIESNTHNFTIPGGPHPPEVISACRAIVSFVGETSYVPLACELYLVDPLLEIGGTGDDIGILDGKVGFMDLKTSNIGDKNSYFYQVALYVYMFEKLYKIRTHWHKILHVSKTDGTYKLIDIPDIRKRIKEAKHIVKVDKFLEQLKQEKKKESIII